jgi:hypothetical protein
MTPAVSATALTLSLNARVRMMCGQQSAPIKVTAVCTTSGPMLQIASSATSGVFLCEYLEKRISVSTPRYDEPLRIRLDQVPALMKPARGELERARDPV